MLFKKKEPAVDEIKKTPFEVAAEYVQALVYAVVLAFVIRGFLFEPFKIPSESMVPTLLVGDHIFVARYVYGLRVPMTKKWLREFDDPKRGDVVVFSYPEDEDIDFIKRIVGVPGDKISIKDDILYLNDKPVEQKDYELGEIDPSDTRVVQLTPEAKALLPEKLQVFPYFRHFKEFQEKIETLDGEHYHYIQRSKTMPIHKEDTWIVPPRHFFVMGDNRDQSQDSRFWGFVPRENLKGRAIFIWLSLDNVRGWFRWGRFGREIL